MENFEHSMPWNNNDEDMMMPYPPMHDMPCPMSGPNYPMNGMPHPMPEPNNPMHGMPCPVHGPNYPMNGMPGPNHPMHGMPCPMHGPNHPMHCMPHPMPPEECTEEALDDMEQKYYMHMYISAMNKTEAYRQKMMRCYCKQNINND